jgi:acyl-CoA reductase-like NAD-dependent aldehyde dehydrogenase
VYNTPSEILFTCLALTKLAHRLRIPKGVVSIVIALANTAEVSEALTTYPVIKKIALTGSMNISKLLIKQASPSLKFGL